jgi:hypothetical protein
MKILKKVKQLLSTRTASNISLNENMTSTNLEATATTASSSNQSPKYSSTTLAQVDLVFNIFILNFELNI